MSRPSRPLRPIGGVGVEEYVVESLFRRPVARRVRRRVGRARMVDERAYHDPDPLARCNAGITERVWTGASGDDNERAEGRRFWRSIAASCCPVGTAQWIDDAKGDIVYDDGGGCSGKELTPDKAEPGAPSKRRCGGTRQDRARGPILISLETCHVPQADTAGHHPTFFACKWPFPLASSYFSPDNARH
jgi:hypothetical protein